MNDPQLPRSEFLLQLDSNLPPFDIDEVLLVDALDELFRLELLLRSLDHDVDLAALVGTQLRLSFPSPAGRSTVAALVLRATQERIEESGVSFYRLIAAPPSWLMNERRGCRIFQQVSSVDIACQLASEYGGLIPRPAVRVFGEVASRETITQYGESDYQFLQRLLAEDGLSAAGRYDGSGALTLSDDSTVPITRISEAIAFVSISALIPTKFHVHDCKLETVLAAGSVTRRDFDFEKPLLLLEGTARPQHPLGVEAPLESYGFEVGAFHDRHVGDRLAAKRVDALRSERIVAWFEANFTLAPGAAFTVLGHPRADVNIEWLVLRCETHARGQTSKHRLQCVPLATSRRPALRSKPRVIGTHTAFVVGDEGREIDVDEHGRVCVKFHWDRRADTKETSRRARVSQGWAGPGYGFVCLPRIGDEVIVEFLDGDPDQPIIVGRVHNGLAKPPQTLPAQATRSTWRSRSSPGGQGFNEITFEDAAGGEQIFVHAQRDVAVEVLHDVSIRVDGHVNSNVKGNASGGVVGSGSLNVDGDAKVTVGGTLTVHAANISASADGDVVLSAGSQRHDESSNHFVSTGGFYVRAGSVAQFVTPQFHVLSGDIRLVAGGSTIIMSDAGIAINSAGPVTINGSIVKLNC